MFLITNRKYTTNADGTVTLGDTLNPKGPEELRAVEVTGTAANPKLRMVEDWVSADQFTGNKEMAEMIKDLGIETKNGKYPGSAYVAFQTLKAFAGKPPSKRHLLLFVHGYNSSVSAVVETALDLEAKYGVVCLPFTWPSNGGGSDIWSEQRGRISYLSDKQDARNSVNALDRFITRLFDYIDRLFAKGRAEVEAKAVEKFPEDQEKRRRYLSQNLPKVCPVVVNLLLHSMGNYLFEYVMKSESNRASKLLLFENVVLAAADVNNFEHAAWVDRIPFRRNLYVTINEDDFALNLSRMKFGDEQKPRLGHFRHALIGLNVKYVDFTKARDVGDAHTYFLDRPITNPVIKKFFAAVFSGGRGEEAARLTYDVAENVYRI